MFPKPTLFLCKWLNAKFWLHTSFAKLTCFTANTTTGRTHMDRTSWMDMDGEFFAIGRPRGQSRVPSGWSSSRTGGQSRPAQAYSNTDVLMAFESTPLTSQCLSHNSLSTHTTLIEGPPCPLIKGAIPPPQPLSCSVGFHRCAPSILTLVFASHDTNQNFRLRLRLRCLFCCLIETNSSATMHL